MTPVFTVKAVCPHGNRTVLYPAYGPVRVLTAPEGVSSECTEPDYIVLVPLVDGANMELRIGGRSSRDESESAKSPYGFPAVFGAIYVTDAHGHTVASAKISRFNCANPKNEPSVNFDAVAGVRVGSTPEAGPLCIRSA